MMVSTATVPPQQRIIKDSALLKIRVGHILHEMCGTSATFIHRLVTNRAIENSVFCELRSNPELYPHPQVMTTQSAQVMKRVTRKFMGASVGDHVFDKMEQWQWKRFLSRYQPQILHCQHGSHAVRFLHLLKASDLPFVVTFHGSDINTATFRSDYLCRLKIVFAEAACCLFVSNTLRERAIELGAPPEKCRVVYLGVNESDITSTPSNRTRDCQFALVASFVPCKGHETILHAFQSVLETLPDAKLHLFGDGPLRDRLQWLIQSLQIQDNVSFHGEVRNTDLLKFLAEKVDMIVQPSQRDDAGCEEGLPTSLCEAATLNLPCIGTDCGGISELIIDEKSGLLIRQRDITGLAKAMLQLAHDPALRERLGRSLNVHYQKMINNGHGLDAVTDVYHSLVSKLCLGAPFRRSSAS